MDVERLVEARQLCPPSGVSHHLRDETVGGETIVEHDDEVAAHCVAGIDHLAHAFNADIEATSMQVGDDGDGQALAGPTPRRPQPVVRDNDVMGGLGGSIGGSAWQYHPGKASET